MTNLVVSDSTKNRRSELAWQRRWKRLRSCWQFFALSGLAGGMVWVMSWPEWSIRSDQQVSFVGHQLLSDKTLHKLLPLSYPQSVWQLSTKKLDQQLESNASLAAVEITRQIFPAQLTIAVQERQPVAIAVQEQTLGYLDIQGYFMPASFYEDAVKKKFPQTPQFLGFSDQYRPFWQTYQDRIRQSPVNIRLINGNDPSRITLTTDLGQVFLGSSLNRFDQQLSVLEKMQNLPRRIPKERVFFIDLTNPDQPSIRVKPQSSPPPKKVKGS